MIVVEWETAFPDFASLHPGYKLASQLASAALAKLGKRLIGKPVELAALGIPSDLVVETGGVEFLEPSAESRKLVSAQTRHRSFDPFHLGHNAN